MPILLVNTDDQSGGEYASQFLAEAAVPATLADDYEIRCQGAAADITPVAWTGIDRAGFNLEVWQAVSDRHNGVKSTDRYRLDVAVSDKALYLNVPGMVVDGLQVLKSGFSNIGAVATNNAATLRSMIVSVEDTEQFAYANTSSGLVTIINSLFLGSVRYGMFFNGSGVDVYNCLVFGSGRDGLWAMNGPIKVSNTMSLDSGVGYVDFNGSFDAGSDCNISSDGTAPGSNSLTAQVATDLMTNPESGDYTLKAGSNAIAAGSDLSIYFTDDITGAVRSLPWDIGAFLFASGSGTPYQAIVDLQAVISNQVFSQVDTRASVSNQLQQFADLVASIANQVVGAVDLHSSVGNHYSAAIDLRSAISRLIAQQQDLQAAISNQIVQLTDLLAAVGTSGEYSATVDLLASVSNQVISDIDLNAAVSNQVESLVDTLVAVGLGLSYSVSIDTLVAVSNVISGNTDLGTSIANQVTFLTDLLVVLEDARQQIDIIVGESSAAAVLIGLEAPRVVINTEDGMQKYNEGTTVDVPLQFQKANGDLIQPLSAVYIVTDVASKTAVIDATPFVPEGPEVLLVLPAEATTIINQDSLYEDREVAIVITVDGEKIGVGKHVFRVINVLGVN